MVGIEVGYQFYSRAEMVAVGFHSHWLNGIDYMGQSYAKAVMVFLAMLYLFICTYKCIRSIHYSKCVFLLSSNKLLV